MSIINLKNSYVQISDIKKCVEELDYIVQCSELHKEIILIADLKIEGIDPLLITYFILYKKADPEIRIELRLPHNPIDQDDEKFEFQLKQFGTYAYLITGLDVFNVIFGTNESSRISFALEEHDTFPNRWFVFSEDFFPIFLITKNYKQFDFLFNNSFAELLKDSNNPNPQILDEKIAWDKSSSRLKRNFHNHVRSNANPKKRSHSLIELAKMYFINALDEAKIAHLYYEKEYDISIFNNKNRIQAGSLVNIEAILYYKEIVSIFNELEETSIFHIFLFSTILTKEALVDIVSGKDVLNSKTRDEYILKFKSLWGFTKDLVAGIKELAKNIHEHADPNLGAISVRLFEIDSWINIKNSETQESLYRNYKVILHEMGYAAHTSIIDINVIDIGKNGVVQTLTDNSKKVLDGLEGKGLEIESLIQDDIKALKENEIGFRNLLDLKARQLHQQSKRAIAHLGLPTFSKLVEHVNGLIVASSRNDNLENCRESVITIPELIEDYSNPITVGTTYNVILPIKSSEPYSTHLPQKISIPFETSAKDIKGIEELFNYEFVSSSDLEEMRIIKDSKIMLIGIEIDKAVINSREVEEAIWRNVELEVNTIVSFVQNNLIFCINFKSNEINESQLFRFIGKWELYFPKLQMVLLNVHNRYYQGLIKLNGEFFDQNSHLSYWDSINTTVIYSHIDVDENRFYFADVLWGKVRADFIYLNWKINQTSFNSTSLLHNDDGALKKIIEKYEVGEVLVSNLLFSENNLLPLDLVIQNSKVETLFEQNAIVLLNNELNQNYYDDSE